MSSIEKKHLFSTYDLLEWERHEFKTKNIKKIKNRAIQKASKKNSGINKKTLLKWLKMFTKWSNNWKNNFRVNFIKRWFISFLSVIAKKGRSIKYINYLLSVFKKLRKSFDLYKFFKQIEYHLYINFGTFKKKVAGRNILMPMPLNPYKRINAITRLIITSLKLRKEKYFVERLLNELNDIFQNKGLTINKRLILKKQFKDLLLNERFFIKRK